MRAKQVRIAGLRAKTMPEGERRALAHDTKTITTASSRRKSRRSRCGAAGERRGKSTDSFKGRVTRHGNNLIAEDHESIREMSRQALLGMGYRALPACDGHEALELCSHETPALAILDVIMPKLGGPAAASRLLKMFPRLPVVFTSGYSADASELPTEGMQAHYLQKPYSPTTLGRLVRETLDQPLAEKPISPKANSTR
jgi:CheY-like chemotaxis protein